MTTRSVEVAEAVALLSRTPRLFDCWLRDLPDGWIGAREREDTWTPYDVVGHLIHGERTDWLPRVRRILQHGETLPFEPFDRAAQFRDSVGKSLGDLIDEFTGLRVSNMRELTALHLDDAMLARRGTHPVFAGVTLGQLLATWVAHDLDHVMQIARIMAAQYREEVGPWRAYLRIISGQQG